MLLVSIDVTFLLADRQYSSGLLVLESAMRPVGWVLFDMSIGLDVRSPLCYSLKRYLIYPGKGTHLSIMHLKVLNGINSGPQGYSMINRFVIS